MGMMLVAGFGMMQGMASSNTIIQTIVSEDKRGRVMSYYTIAFVGMAPFGSLLAGTMAHWFGAPLTVITERGHRDARRAVVHHPPARRARRHPSHLSRDGNPPCRSRQRNDQRRRKLAARLQQRIDLRHHLNASAT